MATLLSELVTLEPNDSYPLHITAKRYWITSTGSSQARSGEHTSLRVSHEDDTAGRTISDANGGGAWTLIFLHSTSFHKETWQPTIQAIYLSFVSSKFAVDIREAWAIECPNHGQSAVLNSASLASPQFRNNFSCQKYADAVQRFLDAGPNNGAKVDFRSRRLLGIGHSLGAVAMSILLGRVDRLPFESAVLIEPMLNPLQGQELEPLRSRLVRSASKRKYRWDSRRAALDTLESKTSWDPRVIDAFIDFGLRTDPVNPSSGVVTLSCTPDEEVTMYKDADALTKPLADLDRACSEIPIHLIRAGLSDFIPRKVQEALTDHSFPRRFSSFTEMAGIGHLIPQEAPDALGRALFDIILKQTVGTILPSKL